MNPLLIALLKAQSILREERLNSKSGSLSSSLDCDLDEISDRIHHIVQESCKDFGFSDYDMSLIDFLKRKGIALENMSLLGWSKEP
jgi:hypothetical protein